MVDDEKHIGKIETPPVGKRIQSDAPHQRVSVEAEVGLKGSPLPSGEGRHREDEEIFQAIHDTINHILQLVSGAPAPHYVSSLEQQPLGYSFAMNYPQALPTQVCAPFAGVQYAAAPQAIAWPGATVQTPYLIQ